MSDSSFSHVKALARTALYLAAIGPITVGPAIGAASKEFHRKKAISPGSQPNVIPISMHLKHAHRITESFTRRMIP